MVRVVDASAVSDWLESYGRAWEARDSSAFARLFSRNVRYHWTPFEAAKEGRPGLAEAFETATARQERIAFRASVLAVHDGRCLAHWQCSFVRPRSELPVRLDGIFLMEFNAERECTLFREWWHSDESLPSEYPQDRVT
jgi:hypothetical protein